jgi:DNA (cytosine-5)-methyltransferase 1
MPLFLDLRENKNGVRQAASWVTGGALLGEYTMLSFGEFPKEEKESHLSQILQGGQLQKYYLSEKACQGILRRAKTRGKQLPEILYKTLMKQARLSASKNEPDAMGGAKESSSNTIESEHYRPSTINQCCREVYGISAYESNCMKSQNPNSGIYKADTTRTLDNNGGNPACNQGGMIVLEGNGSRPSHKGDGYAESDTSYTLNATERHAVCTEGTEPCTASKASFFCKSHCDGKAETLVATDYKDPQIVCYGLDRASFNQGQNAKYDFSVENDLAQTIVAKGPGGGY